MSDASAEELTLIGSVLVTPELLGAVCDLVTPLDFGDPGRAAIWDALLRLDLDEVPVDAVTLRGRLAELGTLDVAGGAKALGALLAYPRSTERALRFHAAKVSEAGRHRRISRAVGSLAGQAEALTADQIEAAIEALVAPGGPQVGICDRAEVSASAWQMLEAEAEGRLEGIATGLPDLDRLIRHGGWRPGQAVYVGARTSWGKSALCLGFAEAAAMRGRKALVFPLEMTPEDLEIRRYVSEAEIDMGALRSWSGADRAAALRRLGEARARLADRPLYYARTAAWTTAKIRAACRRQKQRPGLEVAVVDYLGLVEHDKAAGSLYEQTTKTSKALKAMALELGIVVIAAVQLNRDAAKGGQGGKSRRPGMADFRDSGAIEQDCDVGILIHQEGGQDGIQDGEAMLIVGKQRNGPKGDVTVRWRASCGRFESIASVQEMPTRSATGTREAEWRDD